VRGGEDTLGQSQRDHAFRRKICAPAESLCPGGRAPDAGKEYLTALVPDEAEYRYYALSFGKRPSEELYQIRWDPHCMNNLAKSPEFAAVKKRLRAQMEAELTAQGDPRTLGKGNIFDGYLYAGPTFNYGADE